MTIGPTSPPKSDCVRVAPSLCDLARAAQQGDRSAHDAFARELHGVTTRTVDQHLGSALRREVEIDDVVQDVFVAIQRQLPTLRILGERQLHQWLQQLVVHRLDDLRDYHVRARMRDPRRERPLASAQREGADAPRALEARDAPPLHQAIDRELFRLAQAELARLPARQRDAVRRIEVDGQTIAEVARELGRPASTIRSRHAEGLAEIARRMSEAARERRRMAEEEDDRGRE